MMDMVWIDHVMVLAIHDRQLAEYGGAEGQLSASDFAAWLRPNLRPEQVHETPAIYRSGTTSR